LPAAAPRRLTIVAEDGGSDWGAWLAVAMPRWLR
jgi:hypothetical protein